ncbi:hypothetical protein PCURB6_12190 [Paenibacillus curdlanolyticus]|nr:hypothetical protein PCURB6_12190 [Paenibacillus curdlanolyticus]
MKYKPMYAENIIVAVIYKNGFSWYVTEKECWILDIIKRANDFLRNGYDYELAHVLESRFQIKVINEDTADLFLSSIYDCKVKALDLKNLVESGDVEDTILSLRPSLYVNFDSKQLFSNFPETLPFERYVPAGWVGKYKSFDEFVPVAERYWIFNDIDLIDVQYKVELERSDN